jgi:hypothetical protein
VITRPFQKCRKTFHKLSTFTAHVSRCHKNWDVVCIDGLYKVDGRLHALSISHMCDSENTKHTDELTETSLSLAHCGDAMERESDVVDSLLHEIALWLTNLEVLIRYLSRRQLRKHTAVLLLHDSML